MVILNTSKLFKKMHLCPEMGSKVRKQIRVCREGKIIFKELLYFQLITGGSIQHIRLFYKMVSLKIFFSNKTWGVSISAPPFFSSNLIYGDLFWKFRENCLVSIYMSRFCFPLGLYSCQPFTACLVHGQVFVFFFSLSPLVVPTIEIIIF